MKDMTTIKTSKDLTSVNKSDKKQEHIITATLKTSEAVNAENDPIQTKKLAADAGLEAKKRGSSAKVATDGTTNQATCPDDPSKIQPICEAEVVPTTTTWAHSFSVADAAVTTASRRYDQQGFEEDFGYLVFHEQELANSFETEKGKLAPRKLSNQLGSNQTTAALSTRSGTESERAQWLQLQLRQLKLMT